MAAVVAGVVAAARVEVVVVTMAVVLVSPLTLYTVILHPLVNARMLSDQSFLSCEFFKSFFYFQENDFHDEVN